VSAIDRGVADAELVARARPTGDRGARRAQQRVEREGEPEADHQQRERVDRLVGYDAVVDLQQDDGKRERQQVDDDRR